MSCFSAQILQNSKPNINTHSMHNCWREVCPYANLCMQQDALFLQMFNAIKDKAALRM